MKLWDVMAMCLLLLSSVSTRPLYQKLPSAQRAHPRGHYTEPLSMSVEEPDTEALSQQISMEEQYDITGPYPEQFDDVMDFIEATIGRLRRSSEPDGGSRGRGGQTKQRGAANSDEGGGGRREKKKGRGRKGKGRSEKEKEREREREKEREKERALQSRGCLLKEVHLNVTDLGLGYQTREELIFRYCSGPCSDAETNYDKILNNLTHNRKLDRDTPARTCCRPIAFDDDLSFLDDNVVYHTLKKHSARRCGCV